MGVGAAESRAESQETLAEFVAAEPLERAAFFAALTPEEIAALPHHWRFWARPSQLPPPGDWHFWLLLTGRRFGKTRAGAEWVRGEVESGRRGNIALIGSCGHAAAKTDDTAAPRITAAPPPPSRD